MSLDKLRKLLKKNGVELRPVRRLSAPVIQNAQPVQAEADPFKQAMREVEPLTPHGRALPAPPRLTPLPRHFFMDERETIRESLEAPLRVASGHHSDSRTYDEEREDRYVRPGLSGQTLRRLRGGDWRAQAELDLHGLTVVQARHEFAEFLYECKRRGVHCVRIIHGKGLRSANGESVLKQQVRHWLRLRNEVLAFLPARPADGGSGAVVVLLKTHRARHE